MPNIPPKHGSISSIIILTGLYLSIFLVGLLYNAINMYVTFAFHVIHIHGATWWFPQMGKAQMDGLQWRILSWDG